jgi:hypothetical protein
MKSGRGKLQNPEEILTGLTGLTGLGEHLFYHFAADVGETEVAAGVAVG